MAEFLGTFIILAFGDGCVAMAVAALPGSGRAATPTTIFLAAGDWLLIAFGWCFAVAFAVWVAGGVSGAHLNPAVTLAFAARRGFPWRKVVPYWAAQVVRRLYRRGPRVHGLRVRDQHVQPGREDPEKRGPARWPPTRSSPRSRRPYFHGSNVGPLIDQIVGTAFLVMFVVAVIDARNTAVGANLGPLIIGFIVAAIGISYGANAGYAINPARDFGPRLFAWIAGWGKVALPGTYHAIGFHFSDYFWIPIVGPLIGGVIGVLIYDLFIGDVLHARLKLAENVEGPIARGSARPPTSPPVRRLAAARQSTQTQGGDQRWPTSWQRWTRARPARDA